MTSTIPARSALPTVPAEPAPSAGRPGHLGTYARLPRLAGPWFLPLAFLARLPFSMITIGTLLLVTSATGSLALGGLTGAASALGTAVGGPTQGAVADRLGQRWVLLVAVVGEVVAVLALVQAAGAGHGAGPLLAAAAATGALAPQVGPLARVRWMALTTREPATLDAALGYESTADEVSFVLGPAAVGILATAVSPSAALLVAAGLCAVFGTAVALHPTATLRAPRTAATGGRRGDLARAVVGPAVGMVAMGTLFGGTQALVTAVMRDAGHESAAGLVYAVMGAGSAVTALAVVALPAAWGLKGRWAGFAGALVVGAGLVAGAAAAGSTPLLVAALAVAGLCVGPVMVTIFTVGSRRSPAGRTAAVMTVLASSNVVGVALGAAVGGRLAEGVGTTSAALVPVAAALALLVSGAALRVSGTSRPLPGTDPEQADAPAVG